MKRALKPETFSKAKYQRGVGVINLLMVITLVSIVSATAASSVGDMMDRNTIMAARLQLTIDFNLARTTAINNDQHIVVCPSKNQQTCSGEHRWQDGWIVFEDYDTDGQRDDNEMLVQIGELENDLAISSELNYFGFNRDGSSYASNDSLYLCLSDNPDLGYELTIAEAGRVRSEKYNCNYRNL